MGKFIEFITDFLEKFGFDNNEDYSDCDLWEFDDLQVI
jgi:hypothetical protein